MHILSNIYACANRNLSNKELKKKMLVGTTGITCSEIRITNIPVKPAPYIMCYKKIV